MSLVYSRPWRRDSGYIDPPQNALDRPQRHIWRRRVVAEVRAGNLPGKAILTAEALIACMGEGGELYPSLAALAEKAGVGVRTISRHITRMEELGLLRKHRRLVRMPWPEAGKSASRVQQTSNAYELIFPAGHVEPRRQPLAATLIRTSRQRGGLPAAGKPRPDCDGHSGAEESDSGFLLSITSMDRPTAFAALEKVRVAREAAATANWQKERLRKFSRSLPT